MLKRRAFRAPKDFSSTECALNLMKSLHRDKFMMIPNSKLSGSFFSLQQFSQQRRNKTIGIDLGSTYTRAMYWQGNDEPPLVIPNILGHEKMRIDGIPSMIVFHDGKVLSVGGDQICQQPTRLPKITVFELKRLLGHTYRDLLIQAPHVLLSNQNQILFIQGQNGEPLIQIGTCKYSPVELLSLIFEKVKHNASTFFGEEISQAVVAISPYMNDESRAFISQAGRMCGLNISRCIYEPHATALAFGLHEQLKPIQTVMVCDFGARSCNISILEMDEFGLFELKSTKCNFLCSGLEVDLKIGEWISNEMKKIGKCTAIPKDRFLMHAEQAKKELSVKSSTDIKVPILLDDVSQHDASTEKFTLSLTEMERVIPDFAERAEETIQQCLTDANLHKQSINHVLLVGGMSKMPLVKRVVSENFGFFTTPPNPQESVVLGCAIQAGRILA
ncbi:hypothetical protein C9374_001823 [Naegleria lovaniensis]|uniref:Uncharacterized protein n=1 Tax=Naegleria lovaniensis TaxID=51637 RepID=A0AA88GVR5_NAELO|nr:uncharacterized protein C9374_001823 [Naegleria lovaniensis]KAG2386788.1 hypothetical protein C9374_001823 [Naegleria lovaniensis]